MRHCNDRISHGTYNKLKDTYKILSCIKAGADDEARHTWLEVDRGPVEAFGDYEEFREIYHGQNGPAGLKGKITGKFSAMTQSGRIKTWEKRSFHSLKSL